MGLGAGGRLCLAEGRVEASKSLLSDVKGLGARVASAMHNRPEGRRSMRRRLATLFVFATAAASVSGLSSCGEAKEDPAEERRREVQQQVQQPSKP